MSVDFCGFDVGVTHQLLNDPDNARPRLPRDRLDVEDLTCQTEATMTKNASFVPILDLVVLTMTIAILATTAQVMAQTPDAQDRIDTLETRSAQVAEQRRQVREDLNKADHLARVAADWFQKKSQVDAEIQRLEEQKKSGSFNIYDTRQMDDQLQALRSQQDAIMRLEGGLAIDGFPYRSLFELQEEVKSTNSEVLRLNDEYARLTQELRALDQERDGLIPMALDQAKTKLRSDKFTLSYLREDLEMLQSVVNNNELWILQHVVKFGGMFPHMSRQRAITILTNEYILYVQATPGKKVDHRELSEIIKKYQAESEAIKREVRERIIPERIREIEEIQRRINLLEGGAPEIQGCWVVMVGSGDYPVIEIAANAHGDFEAIINRVGQLDFFKRGNRLFSVHRINDDTFDGTEYSFTADGRPTQVPLRLIVSRDGKSIHYRADSILTLRRCD